MLITQKEKKEYELPKAGLIAAVCVDVIDVGEAMGVQPDDLGRYLVPTKKPEWKPKPRVKLVFELETKMQDGRPFVSDVEYPASLFKPEPGQTGQIAKLRENLDNWGVELPTEGNVDLKTLLLGKSATLNIKHDPDKNVEGKFWANVSTINPETKALEPSGEWDPTAARDRIKERALKSTVQAATDAVTEDNQPY